MNKELLELYFQLEEKISDNTKKKDETTKVMTELYTKFSKECSSNILLKNELDNFVKQNIFPLLEKAKNKTTLDEAGAFWRVSSIVREIKIKK